ncbi:MAG: hypothetical protein ACOX3T_07150 [Bdellovibrionota bacterium]|jgi:hypothetical protein
MDTNVDKLPPAELAKLLEGNENSLKILEVLSSPCDEPPNRLEVSLSSLVPGKHGHNLDDPQIAALLAASEQAVRVFV